MVLCSDKSVLLHSQMTTGKSIQFWLNFSKTVIFPTFISRLSEFLLSVLKSGPVPGHVGFIMDGNRTYAKTKNMSPTEGHAMGALTLQQVRNSP